MFDKLLTNALCWWLGWKITWSDDEPGDEQDRPPPRKTHR